jgi:hypothetical protein
MRTSRAWAALLLALLLAATTMAPAADAVPPGGRIIGPEPEYFGDPDQPASGSAVEKPVPDLMRLRFRLLLIWNARIAVLQVVDISPARSSSLEDDRKND